MTFANIDDMNEGGGSYGKFYDFIFKMENKEEETTIGYAANYAAKLQNITNAGFISISENIYEEINDEHKCFFLMRTDNRISKYKQSCYYTANLSKFKMTKRVENGLEYAKDVAYRVNLNEMNFASPIFYKYIYTMNTKGSVFCFQ